MTTPAASALVQLSEFHIVSSELITITGLAAPAKLRNISGFNWPSPPLSIDHVTYCYIDQQQSEEIDKWAADNDATFRSEEVYREGNR